MPEIITKNTERKMWGSECESGTTKDATFNVRDRPDRREGIGMDVLEHVQKRKRERRTGYSEIGLFVFDIRLG